jgi:hypothetical protein
MVNGGTCSGFYVAIYQETFAIFRDVIGKNVGGGNRSAPVNLEERDWCPDRENVFDL